MPLPRPMATPLRTDAAGAPSFGADAPPNFRFRLAFFSAHARAVPPRRPVTSSEARPCACPLTLRVHWSARLTNEQLGRKLYPMKVGRRRALTYECADRPGMCLLLGAAGVGKTLLVKRLQNILLRRVGGTDPRRAGPRREDPRREGPRREGGGRARQGCSAHARRPLPHPDP